MISQQEARARRYTGSGYKPSKDGKHELAMTAVGSGRAKAGDKPGGKRKRAQEGEVAGLGMVEMVG